MCERESVRERPCIMHTDTDRERERARTVCEKANEKHVQRREGEYSHTERNLMHGIEERMCEDKVLKG